MKTRIVRFRPYQDGDERPGWETFPQLNLESKLLDDETTEFHAVKDADLPTGRNIIMMTTSARRSRADQRLVQNTDVMDDVIHDVMSREVT